MCLCVRKIEFHRKRQVEAGREWQRQVEKGRGRYRKAEAGRKRKRQAVAGKVVGNVPSLYIPLIRQRQVEKGRSRQGSW